MSSAVQAMAKRESCTVGWTRGLRSGRWVARIVVVVLAVAVTAGCANKSKLSREKAEKLITEVLMKKPPAAEVELRMEVPNILERRSEWEAFLAGLKERGYEPSVEGEPPSFREEEGALFMRIGPDVAIMLSLPRDLTALDMGPYQGCGMFLQPYERGRLLRYGKRVRVRVTGIQIGAGGTQAVAEYEYEWEVDEEARKALERLQRGFDELRAWVRQFSFGNRIKLPDAPKIPRELSGRNEMKLQLYDDGWRAVTAEVPEHPCF